jgi:ribosomal protein S3
MGQKVHPLGFRVGITKKHQSQWFAKFQKYNYSQSVFEDYMLRKTLLNLFSNLSKENAVATKQSKKNLNTSKTPKITQIKIERGLIPYEIGIQVHSNDCLSITEAIDNIKISKDLVSQLEKTRKYLFLAGSQLKKTTTDLTKENTLSSNESNLTVEKNAAGGKFPSTTKKRKIQRRTIVKQDKKVKTKASFKPRRKIKKKLSKSVFMRLKNLKRRFKKRQLIKKRYSNIIAKGLLIRKKGNLIIRNQKSLLSGKRRTKTKLKTTPSYLKVSKNKVLGKKKALTKSTNLQRFSNRMYKKFASLFLTKLNKQFLVHLKSIMKYWTTQNSSQAPLGYNKKWYSAKSYALINNLKSKYLAKDVKVLASYQVEKLTKLIEILEKKSVVKMETLRKDFITFGTLSKTRAFGYYQIITFLKQLKELVRKIKKQTISTINTNKPLNVLKKNIVNETTVFAKNTTKTNKTKEKIQTLIRAKSIRKNSITKKALTNFVNLVNDNKAMVNECRKIKLISYLKDLVQKHRTNNIFYYLATIADARKDLKKLKQYIKQHSNFLFGVNLSTSFDSNALLQRVTKTLTQSKKNIFTNTSENSSLDGLTSLQKAFLTQLFNQRKMYKANLALTPKISIKFFSVKRRDVLEKATTVAHSIVDALEKRKAFRGVIKKAKEDLMDRPRVKGVKIQVSGRLNGAEIARSEWVRAGRVPLQTLRANIDYAYTTASTIYGIIGVKVWIFKGYSKVD